MGTLLVSYDIKTTNTDQEYKYFQAKLCVDNIEHFVSMTASTHLFFFFQVLQCACSCQCSFVANIQCKETTSTVPLSFVASIGFKK